MLIPLLLQIWADKLPEAVKENRLAFRDLIRVMRAQKFNTPEVPIEDEGFPMDSLYIVIAGSCWMQIPSPEPDDSTVKIRKLVPGDVAGENFCGIVTPCMHAKIKLHHCSQ